MSDVFNIHHPVQTLSGIAGARRITMTRSACLSFSYVLEAAAETIERDGRVRIAERLREFSADWRKTAETRAA